MKNANLQSPRRIALLLLALALPLGGCGGERSTDVPEATATVATWFTVRVGATPVKMQIAVTDEEMARGLMHRRDLAQDQGMLFAYRYPTKMSFYMKNTPTALDIGFFDDGGVLREIYPMYPFDEKTVASHADNLMYALEVNQGWFRANNIRPGAKLDLAAVDAALKARGFSR